LSEDRDLSKDAKAKKLSIKLTAKKEERGLKDSRKRLILASSSPRRKELLETIGVPFEIVVSDIEECLVAGETPEQHVLRLSMAKALDVSKAYSHRWILGADTIVVIDGIILGKPADKDEAQAMLANLSGRRHAVFTGYTLYNASLPLQSLSRYVRSYVSIKRMTREEIVNYVKTGEPMDKAGAYAVQGLGAAIVKRVEGSYTNVVGLPLCEVVEAFGELGIFRLL